MPKNQKHKEEIAKKNLERDRFLQVHAMAKFWFGLQGGISGNDILRSIKLSGQRAESLSTTLFLCDGDFFSLMRYMDHSERGKAIAYVLDNYNGVKKETIKKYYI